MKKLIIASAIALSSTSAFAANDNCIPAAEWRIYEGYNSLGQFCRVETRDTTSTGKLKFVGICSVNETSPLILKSGRLSLTNNSGRRSACDIKSGRVKVNGNRKDIASTPVSNGYVRGRRIFFTIENATKIDGIKYDVVVGPLSRVGSNTPE